MPILEFPHLGFLLRQVLPRLLQLVFQEVGRIRRALLPLRDIFGHEKFGQLFRRRLRHLGIAAVVINIECREFPVIPSHQLDLYIFSHPLDQIVVAHAFPVLGIQTEAVDDAQQPGAAQYLLRNAVQLLLNIGVDIRNYVLLGHRGLLDQNQRPRPVRRWDQPARAPHHQPAKEKRRQKLPPSPADDSLDLTKLDWRASFL